MVVARIALGVLVLVLMVWYPIYFLTGTIRARRQQRRGPSVLTLLAWMMVIFAVAASVVPNFQSFPLKARQSEAKSNLSAIFTAHAAYKGATGRFPEGSKAFSILQWSPKDVGRYAYFCGDDAIPNTDGEVIGARPGAGWPVTERPAATADAFTCMAVSNIDFDGFIDVWTINDAKDLRNIMDDVKDRDGTKPDYTRTITNAFMLASIALLLGLIIRDEALISRAKKALGPGNVGG